MTTTVTESQRPVRSVADPQILLRLWQGWQPERPELLIRLYPRKPSTQRDA